MSLHEFYTMGGYALYVWPAFAVVAATLGLQWLLAQKHQKKIYKKLKDHRHTMNLFDLAEPSSSAAPFYRSLSNDKQTNNGRQ